jgi:tRNA dimethylallyltransferase
MTTARRRGPAAPPLVAVIGPTAVGKSDFALALAGQLPIEILVADSRQVYRGMDIGTAKPDAAARRTVPHHLIDLVDPDERFSVAQWVERARTLIPEIVARGHLPVVVGGTGLYLSALVDGLDLAAQPFAPEVRVTLEAELEAEGLVPLADRLRTIDPEMAARTDLRNPRRVLRALERALAAGGPTRELLRSAPYPGRLALIGLNRPNPILDRRIDDRAEALFAAGLVDEARTLLDRGYSADLPALSGHGYAEAIRVAMGEWGVPNAVSATARRTRQYARRQLRWFRRDSRIVWLNLRDESSDDPAVVRRGTDLIRALLNG